MQNYGFCNALIFLHSKHDKSIPERAQFSNLYERQMNSYFTCGEKCDFFLMFSIDQFNPPFHCTALWSYVLSDQATLHTYTLLYEWKSSFNSKKYLGCFTISPSLNAIKLFITNVLTCEQIITGIYRKTEQNRVFSL